MTDPKRLLDDQGSANDLERALLREGRAIAPTASDRAAVLASVMTEVGSGGSSGSTGGAGGVSQGPTAVGARLTPVKVLGASAALVLVVTSLWLLSRDGSKGEPRNVAPSPTPSSSVVVVAPPEAAPTLAPTTFAPPILTSATAEPVTVKNAPSAPLVATPPPSASTSLASRLKEERELVTKAREALRSGDVAGANGALGILRTKFPVGVLSEEREALEIEALWSGGKRKEAATRAGEFLERHPNSVHAARVRGFQTP